MGEPKNDFSFHLFGKPTLVMVDWFNIWNKHKNVDLRLFFDYLKSYPEIYQVRFYQGLIKGKEHSHKTLESAKSIGYKVVSKNSKSQPIDIREIDHFQLILKSLDALFEGIRSITNYISNSLYSIKELINGNFDLIDDIDLKLESVNKNILVFKEESKKPIRKTKCDFDAEIARDIALEIDNYENLILFSGDGDFA